MARDRVKDLDQFMLREIAFSGIAYKDEKGRLHAVVPLDLLQRITADFDVEHVSRELKGRSH